MSEFRAWYLPGRAPPPTPLLECAAGRVLAPELTPEDVALAAELAAAAGSTLREVAQDHVIAAIDTVARRFLDPRDPLRTEALCWLPEVTGYHPSMAALVLDRMAADWSAPALRRLVRAELRDPRALGRFVPHTPGQRVRAVPPRLIFHVLAGNVPGVGVTSLIRGLLVRAPAICKTARAEPVLPVIFAGALAEAEPRLADALAVAYWPGGDQALEAAALAAADLLVHYGGAAALTSLRTRAPGHLRIVDHGPRVSFGLVAREVVHRPEVAAEAARAVAVFDQQGCVSPHLIYVETGGRITPHEFADRVAGELRKLAGQLPRGPLSLAEAAAVQQLRATVEFSASGGLDAGLWEGESLAWTVALDPDPTFAASCLGRFLWVKPIPALDLVLELIRPYRAVLQTAAVAAPRRRRHQLADALALAGCTRITTLADMPFPPPSWHHDGRGPLRELLRFTDLESPSK